MQCVRSPMPDPMHKSVGEVTSIEATSSAVEVQVAKESFPARAGRVTGKERERLWEQMVQCKLQYFVFRREVDKRLQCTSGHSKQ
jgi:F420H(2)-dependent quinone reductase